MGEVNLVIMIAVADQWCFSPSACQSTLKSPLEVRSAFSREFALVTHIFELTSNIGIACWSLIPTSLLFSLPTAFHIIFECESKMANNQ